MKTPTCRFCQAALTYQFATLGLSPLANAYIKEQQLWLPEKFYPLDVYVCDHCFLVQLEMCEMPENIFTDYAYYSSYSRSWLEHSRKYSEAVIDRFHLDNTSLVLEIGSNDGYLLQYFVNKNIPVLGIDPALNIAQEAESKGVPTLTEFFNSTLAKKLARENKIADLIIGNNVLAHVPELNDFIEGMKILLHPRGFITLEFPHLMKLIQFNQFDTIYHEHFSYFSLTAVEKIFNAHDFTIFDVEELPTHGGSIRIYVKNSNNSEYLSSERVAMLKQVEEAFGLLDIETYLQFNERVKQTKRIILEYLIAIKNSNKRIAGYGAPAKGNTLLSYCGIGTDIIEYTVDMNPHKQGLFLPGTRIPIFHPDTLRKTRPDYIFILPWNLKDEIINYLSSINTWNAKYIIPIPETYIYEDSPWIMPAQAIT
jgi:2-polyprenyl-3-methyl-5-hydroxy-6-metoxy-1,4-benzoquinol methylase